MVHAIERASLPKHVRGEYNQQRPFCSYAPARLCWLRGTSVLKIDDVALDLLMFHGWDTSAFVHTGSLPAVVVRDTAHVASTGISRPQRSSQIFAAKPDFAV